MSSQKQCISALDDSQTQLSLPFCWETSFTTSSPTSRWLVFTHYDQSEGPNMHFAAARHITRREQALILHRKQWLSDVPGGNKTGFPIFVLSQLSLLGLLG